MKDSNEDRKEEYIKLNSTSELTREEALAMWKKVITESDIENYLEHYKDEKKFDVFYTRIETNFSRLAAALSDENECHAESVISLGNESLQNIKIDGYRTPKRGYLSFSDNPRLKAIALSLHSEEEARRADAKAAAIARQQGEHEPTLEEVLEMEDDMHDIEIANFTVLQKIVNGAPQNFYVKTRLEDGEITQELTHSRAIPIQTAPSIDFCTRAYNSWHEIYVELRKDITDYIAFPSDSIAPDLIALGCVASYFREGYYTYPYFDYISSEPESGKTTAMKVQTFLSYYGTIASSVTEALLFREIDGSHCFYGLDNIERLFASPKDYVAIIDWLLSSYSKDIPCKRLEKTEEGYEVRYFDGYGIKAFTHIRDFPFALRALRSRCIQIVMESGKPKKFYPSAAKFTETRDKLYNARLWEFESVKQSYELLINGNELSGRTGDLYYPLLSIAKLVDATLYTRILHYAKSDELERREYDGWNIALISVLLEKKVFGSHSTKEIRAVYEDTLREKGLLKESDSLHTRTVTMRLKKLGFLREEKKTDNKTWFQIDKESVMLKAYSYNIMTEEEFNKSKEKSEGVHTPPKPNLVNLPNSGEDKDKAQKGSAKRGEEDKASTEEIEQDVNEDGKELTKLGKLAKRGVYKEDKNVCDRCGEDRITTEYNGEWVCDKCLNNYAEKPKEGNSIRPEAFDENFQTRQDKEAADSLGVASDE